MNTGSASKIREWLASRRIRHSRTSPAAAATVSGNGSSGRDATSWRGFGSPAKPNMPSVRRVWISGFVSATTPGLKALTVAARPK